MINVTTGGSAGNQERHREWLPDGLLLLLQEVQTVIGDAKGNDYPIRFNLFGRWWRLF